MKNKTLFLLSFLVLVIVSDVEAETKATASKEEINEYLFGSPNATYLDDYKKDPIVLRAGSDSEFDVKKDVNFGFMSKANPERKVFTFETRNDITSSVIDETKPLRVIIHGWKNDGDSPMIKNITEAYLQEQDVTIMVVDWSLLASQNYFVARGLIIDVARVTGELLKNLIDRKLVKLENVYLIGHSLGGHTVGLVGKKLQDLKVGKVPVLFGLDPAGPLFSLEQKEHRVDKDDAEFVIILHTSTILGFTEPLGHADFYPNYGFSQPGCGLDLMRHCAHSRAYMYFADAIQNGTDEKEFWAVRCQSEYDELEAEKCEPSEVTTRFGESLHKEADTMQGLFVFETNSEKPWAKGKRHLEDIRASKSSPMGCAWKIIVMTLMITCLTL